jgi:catechol 2,3-dioxygenase-like lactoylglutathione lyase family enzyme
MQVRDLPAAIDWFEKVLQVRPGYQDGRMATLIFNSFTIILDAGDADVPVTLGFESDDCDRDFQTMIDRGVIAIARPTNKEWGVRTAYFKGPGALKCEIEGPIANG